jgi:hypothetical protein
MKGVRFIDIEYIAVISGAFLWATVNKCHIGEHLAVVIFRQSR